MRTGFKGLQHQEAENHRFSRWGKLFPASAFTLCEPPDDFSPQFTELLLNEKAGHPLP